MKRIFFAMSIAGLCICLEVAAASATTAHTTPPKIRLAKGSFDGSQYEVTAFREGHAGRSTRPCLSALLSDTTGGASFRRFTTCGNLALGAVQSLTAGYGRARRTVLVMAYEPLVSRVSLDLVGQKDVVLSLTRLGRYKSQMAGLRRFRYGVLVFSGPFCLAHITTYDVLGRIVSDTDEMAC